MAMIWRELDESLMRVGRELDETWTRVGGDSPHLACWTLRELCGVSPTGTALVGRRKRERHKRSQSHVSHMSNDEDSQSSIRAGVASHPNCRRDTKCQNLKCSFFFFSTIFRFSLILLLLLLRAVSINRNNSISMCLTYEQRQGGHSQWNGFITKTYIFVHTSNNK